ncbi:hypothetical protein EMIHUDRAFT_230311 [Emiliania huxleyi CCMP1516]|uniref:Uncharacterized protein n=2 Tax=Emiliania huxleyi TaxID=2903 RepID=A0A0D3KAX5_EMIH1|nr:hypothetical protein EMIHUDRAFT_230311 [Emiliania huxleyi CCMP1516]EOD32910.1 hypothetical protein EMIHUDRAFT_230311 [Emiliania huxleyi CCMP1516]|eukprot:XP_005785339.1 hypothetical protein EMIHUDRAFT_230311 [Emiliania huxleyi CCMP1516]
MSQIERRPNNDGSISVARLLPRPGPKMFGVAIWWALHFASAPYTPTAVEEQRYHDLMQEARYSIEAREEEGQARARLMHAQAGLDQVNVFFWRFREPYSTLVPQRQAEVDREMAAYRALSREREALVSEAKASVGIWSRYGVQEVRETFWGDYEWGKDLAKRMSFWDVVFGVGRGRDEELAVVLLRWVGQILMNFTVGFVSALVAFLFSLVKVLWAYKTGLLSGALFFFIAATGASAMVALVVGGMYTTAVGGVYLVAQNAAQARLQGPNVTA